MIGVDKGGDDGFIVSCTPVGSGRIVANSLAGQRLQHELEHFVWEGTLTSSQPVTRAEFFDESY